MSKIKRFKRIYIEITNVCNLSCTFCQPTKREKRFMSVEEFSHIIHEVKPFTNYVYLHVKGEPLLHPHLEEIIQICTENGIIVDITTNGTLLKKNMDTLVKFPVHRINISVHDADDNSCVDYENYIQELFSFCNNINEKTSTEISLRLWNTPDKPTIFGKNNIDIRSHLSLNIQSPFEWPDIENTYYNDRGFCQGLRTHVAILSDGTVIPCCLDGNGVIPLGNIFTSHFDDILSGKRAQDMIQGFRCRKAIEPLCSHCSFKERFSKK